jgi:hypothetical protein
MTKLFKQQQVIVGSMNKKFDAILNEKTKSEGDKNFIKILLQKSNGFSLQDQRDHIKAATFAVRKQIETFDFFPRKEGKIFDRRIRIQEFANLR